MKYFKIFIILSLFIANTLFAQKKNALKEIKKPENVAQSNTKKAQLHFDLFIAKYNKGDFREGLVEINKCLDFIADDTEFKTTDKYAIYLFYKGETYRVLNETTIALTTLLASEKRAKRPNTKVKIYGGLSNLYLNINDTENALLFANKMLKKPLVDSISVAFIAKAYSAISDVYMAENNPEKAIIYNLKSLELYKKTDDKLILGSLYVNVSNDLRILKEYEKSLLYLDTVTILNKTLQNKYIAAGISLNTAENLSGLKRYAAAHPLFKESTQLFKDLNVTEGEVEAILEQSKAYFNQQQFERAIQLGAKAINKAEINDLLALQEQAYHNLYQIYKVTESKSQALYYHEKYAAAKSKIREKERLKAIENLKIKFDIKQLKSELQLQKNQLIIQEEKQKSTLYFNTLLGIGCIGLLFFIFRQYRLNKAKKKAFNAEREVSILKKIQLEDEIKFKNKEVTDFAIHITEKNNNLTQIKKLVTKVIKGAETETKQKLRPVINYINSTIELNQEKVSIYNKVDIAHQDFYSIIHKKYPNLTKKEIKVASYLRLNLSSKQIANQLGIAPQSVNNYRQNIRKKMGLEKTDSLSEVFKNL